jgi:hypothetical protein
MPTIHIHQQIATRNQNVLEQMLAFHPDNRGVDCWIVIIAHGEALHRIEIAAHQAGIGTKTLEFISHPDRLEFLANKSVRAMQYFHKMHVIAEAFQFGVSSDESILKQAQKLFETTPVRQSVQKWLEIIEKAL